MNSSPKLAAANQACAHVNRALTRAWNQFSNLNGNLKHRELIPLSLDLETLHEIRSLLDKNPEGDEEVLANLECLQSTIFGNLTNCVVRITTASANNAELDDQKRLDIKHEIQGNLMSAAQMVRRLFAAFDMKTAVPAKI